MTFTYSSGTTVEGIVLARTDGWMRVAVRGCRDSVEFVAGPDGAWLSESGETVRLGNRPVSAMAGALDEFICPQDLADRLVTGPDIVTGYPFTAALS